MSTTEQKTVLRAKFLNVTSSAQAYELMRAKLGEPDHVEDYRCEEDPDDVYFTYEQPRAGRPWYRGCVAYGETREYGVELVLHNIVDSRWDGEYGKTHHSFTELDHKAKVMRALFGDDIGEIHLHSYSWYNGGDDPVEFPG